jgi:hypothetical protein
VPGAEVSLLIATALELGYLPLTGLSWIALGCASLQPGND